MVLLRAFSLGVYTITMILGVPLNIMALCVFFRKAKRKITPNVIYMINLCTSDLVFVLLLPIKIVESLRGQWTLPTILCPFYTFMHFSTIYTSALFLTAVSVGRYLSVSFPIKYKMYKKPKYSCLICLTLWLLTGIHVTYIFFLEMVQQGNGTSSYFLVTYSNNNSICYDNLMDDQLDLIMKMRLEGAIVLYFFPLAVTSFCYVSCIHILIRISMPRRKRNKAIRVAVSTLTLFILCFGPYNVSHVIGFAQQKTVSWRREALLVSTCNAFLDPIVFLLMSSFVEKAFNKRWQSVKETYGTIKNKVVASSTSQRGKSATIPFDPGS